MNLSLSAFYLSNLNKQWIDLTFKVIKLSRLFTAKENNVEDIPFVISVSKIYNQIYIHLSEKKSAE